AQNSFIPAAVFALVIFTAPRPEPWPGLCNEADGNEFDRVHDRNRVRSPTVREGNYRDWPFLTVGLLTLYIPIVSNLQPPLHFIIDILQRSHLETMCDAILFCEAARVEQSLRCLLRIAQSQTKIDARLRCRFDLRENMVAIEW